MDGRQPGKMCFEIRSRSKRLPKKKAFDKLARSENGSEKLEIWLVVGGMGLHGDSSRTALVSSDDCA